MKCRPDQSRGRTAACRKCRLTWEEFKNTGRLGCPHCYNAFAHLLIPRLKRSDRHADHVGKRPDLNTPSSDRPKDDWTLREYTQLNEELARAVAVEEFERAAILRDKLHGLHERMRAATDET